MLEAIHGYDDRISTGFIATIQMMLELSKRGNKELAYKLAESTVFPSWGYTIEQGATTIWERWDGYVKGRGIQDGYVKGRGFQDPGMNSFDHYAIGAVGEWMYRVILGINFDENAPGMQHVILAPKPGGTLAWARGYYDSIRGRISSSWDFGENGITYTFGIPPNTNATVILDKQSGFRLCENGETFNERPSVQIREEREGVVYLAVKAGSYTFSIEK